MEQFFCDDLKKVTEGTFQYQYDALVSFTYNLGYDFGDKKKVRELFRERVVDEK